MPLPVGIKTTTIVGRLLDAAGTPLKGTVEFWPSVPVVYVGENLVTLKRKIEAALDSTGNFSVVLPVTDDPAATPTGWTYTVVEKTDAEDRRFSILLPDPDPETQVEYADLVPVASASVVYAYVTTAELDAVRATAEAAETPAGAQAKADAAETDAKTYADALAAGLDNRLDSVEVDLIGKAASSANLNSFTSGSAASGHVPAADGAGNVVWQAQSGTGDGSLGADVTAAEIDSETAASGDVLTANGAGGASWAAPSGGTGSVSSADITDATSTGRAVLTAASKAAGRSALGVLGNVFITIYDAGTASYPAQPSAQEFADAGIVYRWAIGPVEPTFADVPGVLTGYNYKE